MKKMKKPQVSKWLFWTPRILSIIFILFLTLFSFDVIDLGYGFWMTVGAFLIHSTPSIILLITLLIAWKYEWVGAAMFLLAGVAYIILVCTRSSFQWYMISWSLIIAGPAFATGILFWLNWHAKKR